LWVDGKKTRIYTKVSHGEKEIPDNLLGAMARQLNLNKKQFLELVDCPLTREIYVSRKACVAPSQSGTTPRGSGTITKARKYENTKRTGEQRQRTTRLITRVGALKLSS